MQKLLIILVVIFFTNSTYALSTSEYVNALEERLFGSSFPTENLKQRIDRIEFQIYENTYSGSPEERLSKIDKIYPKKDFEFSKTYPQNSSQNYNSEFDEDYTEEIPKADYNSYPIVTKIEESIYKRNYAGEDIYARLDRLEKELYGNTKSDNTLQERVENLKSVLPKQHYNRFAAQDLGFKDFGLKTPTSYENSFMDKTEIIRQLEQETFRHTYEHDPQEKRLARLEQFYFGETKATDNDQNRLSRLASVVINTNGFNNNYYQSSKGAQWAGILMNLLMIGLGFLL